MQLRSQSASLAGMMSTRLRRSEATLRMDDTERDPEARESQLGILLETEVAVPEQVSEGCGSLFVRSASAPVGGLVGKFCPATLFGCSPRCRVAPGAEVA
eukprot:scaffold29_cov251-Pinguiococcus_pyrenoidosus.AAC.11